VAGLNVQLDPEDLAPIIRQIVGEALAALEAERAKLDGKLCYSEGEAAELLGLEERQLADERRRKKIKASSIVGRRIRYTREALLEYLAARPWPPAKEK
jgi:hypothetical protein